jgi:hypothetical protein
VRQEIIGSSSSFAAALCGKPPDTVSKLIDGTKPEATESAKRTPENSPAIYRWERAAIPIGSPRSGRLKSQGSEPKNIFVRPFGSSSRI